MTLKTTIIVSAIALIAAFVVWPELKNGVLIGREVREIDRPYGTAYINVCSYFSTIGITYAIFPSEVIPTRKIADTATAPSVSAKCQDASPIASMNSLTRLLIATSFSYRLPIL
jgi:hypothetical protein